jgi:hypothetical protein
MPWVESFAPLRVLALLRARELLGALPCLLLGLLQILATQAHAAVASVPDDDDSAALSLAGTGGTAAARSASFVVEAALTEAQLPGGYASEQRLSLDYRDDVALGAGWRAVVADRLDLDWLDGGQQINTLKQAYVSSQPLSDLVLDAGRVNARQGVALGYNPTDFFKADALRTVDSLDPDSLRDERLGTVMLRGETLWASGAFTAVYAPRLADSPSDGPFSADLGATNSRNRWLLTLSQRLGSVMTPQWLLFGEQGKSPQAGMNLTSVLGQATVVFVEASAGRMQSLWAESLDLPGSESLRARASSGVTYSTTNKISLSLEYEYDGAALSRAGWNSARQGDPQDYGRYRDTVTHQQELATQHSVFVYASWQDFLAKHLDLSAFVRIDMVDHSRLPWTELRYHWSHLDAAMRWQDYLGASTSDYGASPSRQTWQVLLDYYL